MNKKVITVCFAFLVSMQTYPSLGTEETINVHWDITIYPDDDMKASKVEDFKALLDLPWKEKITVFVKKNDQRLPEKIQLQSCNQALRIEQDLSDAENPLDWHTVEQSLLRCKAMQIMARMQPARVSYLNTNVLSLIPDLAKLQIESPYDQLRLFFSGLKQKAIETKCFRKDYCRVTTKRDVYMIGLVGAGDYNSDGIEDAIFIIFSAPARGTATSGSWLSFVMTRKATGGPLTILNMFNVDNRRKAHG